MKRTFIISEVKHALKAIKWFRGVTLEALFLIKGRDLGQKVTISVQFEVPDDPRPKEKEAEDAKTNQRNADEH